jgi:hypothetical protein
MKRLILFSVAMFVIQFGNARGDEVSLWTIVNSLRSGDAERIEKSCKLLSLEPRAIGLKKVQLVQPSFGKSLQTDYVVSISWEGPYDGYLVVVDKDARVLGTKSVGYVKSICLRPLRQGDHDVLVIDAIRGVGTGIRQDQFGVLAITEKGFDVLWEGLSYERSFPYQAAPDENYEIKCALTFEDIDKDGVDEILYHVKTVRYSYDSRTHELSRKREENETKVYKLVEGKYVLLKK